MFSFCLAVLLLPSCLAGTVAGGGWLRRPNSCTDPTRWQRRTSTTVQIGGQSMDKQGESSLEDAPAGVSADRLGTRFITVHDYTTVEGTFLHTCIEATPLDIDSTATFGQSRCPATCDALSTTALKTCDQLWHLRDKTCDDLERGGCDCAGCECVGDRVTKPGYYHLLAVVGMMAVVVALAVLWRKICVKTDVARLENKSQSQVVEVEIHHEDCPPSTLHLAVDTRWSALRARCCALLGIKPNSLSHLEVVGKLYNATIGNDEQLWSCLAQAIGDDGGANRKVMRMRVKLKERASAMHSKAPMAWPHLSKPFASLKSHYPVLVVGSGYGGGVAASRLSRAGQEVCLLERGQERWPGEYPNKLDEVVPNLQFRAPVLPELLPRVGSRDAFYDFRVEEGAGIWIGCGLGGGSLVNSGVCIAPDMRLFDDDCWPAEVRADKDTRLKTGYDAAEAMLQPAQYSDQENRPLHRITRMSEAAEHLRGNGYPQADCKLADVLVTFKDSVSAGGVKQPACTLCGDCNSGCNIGAKNTVLMNYLPDAFSHGADIFTQIEVEYIERAPTDTGGWIVYCRRTATGAPADPVVIACDTLILAAGTLGTTEILLRSRERGLSMSAQVGLHFGGDGDCFGIAYNGKEPYSTVGYGDDPTAHNASEGDVGPTITTVIDLRDAKADVRQGMIIEDIGVPGIFSTLVNGLYAAGGDVLGEVTDPDPLHAADRLARQLESLEHGPYTPTGATNYSMMLGAMSFDNQDGRMLLDRDVLRVQWSDPSAGPNPPERIHKTFKTCCETPSQQATWVEDPFAEKMRLTIHPFGGCILADDATKGGANHKGQLFSKEEGTEVYEDLYVCDGSTLPTSLGVNPLWTISALAERCLTIMLADKGLTSSSASAGVSQRPVRGVPLFRHGGGVEKTPTDPLSW